MRAYSVTTSIHRLLFCLFDNQANVKSVHSELNSLSFDRWGMVISITLLDGTIIEGRISNSLNFNGKSTDKFGTVKQYRSYRKVRYAA